MAQLQPSTARGQSTRARIVQAAAEVVAEKGAAAMSLDDVGARTHTSRSQLYHYF
jgi:TetR/AcrR family transcriptional repressor of nem operon